MNNPNPFLPKGSLLEQQSQRRSRLKLAVFCVLAVSVTGLVAMLIQGCKREKPVDELNPPPLDLTMTNPPVMDTNPPAMDSSNLSYTLPPVGTNPPPVVTPPPVDTPVLAAGTEYVIAKGDTFDKIGKKFGVSAKAIETANPGVLPTKLKINQKIIIPAGGSATSTSTSTAAPVESSTTTYTVKSGDTLTSIAKKFGTSTKAIQTANKLTTTKIFVSQKLKIPTKASAPAAPAPVVEAPVLPPVSAPVTAPAPAPAPVPAK